MTSRLRPLSAQLYKSASLHVHKRCHGLPDKLGLVPSTELMSNMSAAKYAMHVMHHIARWWPWPSDPGRLFYSAWKDTVLAHTGAMPTRHCQQAWALLRSKCGIYIGRLHGGTALALICTAPIPERGTSVFRKSQLIYESAVPARAAPIGISVTCQVCITLLDHEPGTSPNAVSGYGTR